jgi:hypothetical protein
MTVKLSWGKRMRIIMKVIMIMTTCVVVSVIFGCATNHSGYSPLFRSNYRSSLQEMSDLWLQNRLVEIDTDLAQMEVLIPEQKTYSVTPNYAGGYTISPQNSKYGAGLDGFKQGRTSSLLREKSLILKELNRRRFIK